MPERDAGEMIAARFDALQRAADDPEALVRALDSEEPAKELQRAFSCDDDVSELVLRCKVGMFHRLEQARLRTVRSDAPRASYGRVPRLSDRVPVGRPRETREQQIQGYERYLEIARRAEDDVPRFIHALVGEDPDAELQELLQCDELELVNFLLSTQLRYFTRELRGRAAAAQERLAQGEVVPGPRDR